MRLELHTIFALIYDNVFRNTNVQDFYESQLCIETYT